MESTKVTVATCWGVDSRAVSAEPAELLIDKFDGWAVASDAAVIPTIWCRHDAH